MSEIRNNYAVAVAVFHFKAKVYRASSPKCLLKLQAQMGWVSRKKKGLYFVYFKHYRHPKGEKVQRGKVWFHLVCAYTIFVFQTLCSTPETIHVLKSDNKKKI